MATAIAAIAAAASVASAASGIAGAATSGKGSTVDKTPQLSPEAQAIQNQVMQWLLGSQMSGGPGAVRTFSDFAQKGVPPALGPSTQSQSFFGVPGPAGIGSPGGNPAVARALQRLQASGAPGGGGIAYGAPKPLPKQPKRGVGTNY